MGRMLIAMLIAAAVAVAPTSGAPTQSPRKGGTAHFGEVTEPACLNVLRESCSQAGGGPLSLLVDKILEPAFHVGPDFTWRPRLVSRVTFTRKPPFTLTYRIHRRARWSDGVPVSSQLRQVGIEVVPVFAPPPAFIDQVLPKGDFDVALFAWQHDPSGTGFEAVFGCGGSTNFYGYCQRLVTRDLDQADRILDARQQGRVLNKADRQMARDVPGIPLFQIPLPAAYRATVRGYVHSTTNPLWNAENLWLADTR
jgi:ABC-type transport system substrate-binding protein